MGPGANKIRGSEEVRDYCRFMSGREIDYVVFLGNTKISEEKEINRVLIFTETHLYATIGQILFLKPYRKFFSNNFCGYLLLMITHQTLTTRLFF